MSERWLREHVLGEYGWCILVVQMQDSRPKTLLVEFVSQMNCVRVGVGLPKTGVIKMADTLERCAAGKSLFDVVLDDIDEDVQMLSMDAIRTTDDKILLSFAAQYGITGTVPCPVEDIADVVSVLRDGANHMPDEEN